MAAPLPFSQSNENRAYTFRKRPIRYSLARCTDEYKDVMGLEITRGRIGGCIVGDSTAAAARTGRTVCD